MNYYKRNWNETRGDQYDSWGSDGVYSMNVSYQVPSGSGCCGSGATNGHVGEALVGNSGQTLMVDYCEMSGADAQFFCC